MTITPAGPGFAATCPCRWREWFTTREAAQRAGAEHVCALVRPT